MAINGDISSLWDKKFPSDQIPKVINLILESWKTFNAHSEQLEVPITRKFCVYLQGNRNRSIHFFRIDWESHELDDEANEIGRIDLKFSHGLDEKVYYSIECKRLRVNLPSGFKSLSSKYVTDGMYRYFNGQYARGLDKGGMLGYVMDGDVINAIEDVRKSIENRRIQLFMKATDTLHCCSFLSSSQVKETFHNYGPTNQFVIYHIFLSVTTSLNYN